MSDNNISIPRNVNSHQNLSLLEHDSIFPNMQNSPSRSSIFSNYTSSQSSPMNLTDTTRRPSGSHSRFAYLYNNSFINSSSSTNISNLANISSSNESSNDNTPIHTPPQLRSYNSFPSDRAVFQASSEILACDRSWETPNLVAISTPRNLQLLKVSESDISLQTELTIKSVGRLKIGIISDLAFGHQNFGRTLAASSIAGSVHIYHFDRGTRVKSTLTGHNRAINSIDFNRISPNLLATGSQDGKILIWDLKSSNSKPSLTLLCNADAVRSLSFNNKKSHTLAAVFDSGVVEKWDLRKNSTWERRINAHTGPALSVQWHPELDYIVTGGRDKQLQVWNLESGSEMREPSHVINTSGPIFKAKWCKGRGNNSVMNTDLAVSFFNDDPCVQIWNLNRKFIPKTIIDGHSAQITQIVWRTPKHLISCSKDKCLIQYDVTKEPEFINNVPNGALSWNPSNPVDFAFVKQDRTQFQGPFSSAFQSQSTPNLLRNNTELNTLEEDNISINNTSSNANESISSMQLYENPNKSPGGNSPTLSASFKHQRQPMASRQPSFIKPIQQQQISLPPPAWIASVHIPLAINDNEKFKFLSTHYLINIPETSDIIDVCEFNSSLAAAVGHFRDSQTWNTIKTSIILDNEIKSGEEIESKLQNFVFEGLSTFSRSDSQFGTSFESESDFMKNRNRGDSELSLSYGSEQYQPPNHERTTYDDGAIIDDDDDEVDEVADHNIKKPVHSFGDKNLKQLPVGNNSIEPTNLVNPIEIKRARNKSMVSNSDVNLKGYRYSFTGSSVDMDDEKSGSPLSLSSSPLLHQSRSKLFLNKVNSFSNSATPISITKTRETTLSKASDNRSQLTAILKDDNRNKELNGSSSISFENGDKNAKTTSLQVPWNPRDLIRQAIDYSSQQGDVLMCATLTLLFEKEYPGTIPPKKAEEWIYMYHDYLLRGGYFSNAATVLRIASESYEQFKTIGQTKTSVRTLCCHCMKPILNDDSKERYKTKMEQQNMGEDSKMHKLSFGFWYCDKCRKLQGSCCYCAEPVKGNSIALVRCGHEGHFGCLRSWFIDQEETECPACGAVCVK